MKTSLFVLAAFAGIAAPAPAIAQDMPMIQHGMMHRHRHMMHDRMMMADHYRHLIPHAVHRDRLAEKATSLHCRPADASTCSNLCRAAFHSALLSSHGITDIDANMRLYREVFEPCFGGCLFEHDINRVRDGRFQTCK
jgi:hypothetical protein